MSVAKVCRWIDHERIDPLKANKAAILIITEDPEAADAILRACKGHDVKIRGQVYRRKHNPPHSHVPVDDPVIYFP